MSEGLKFKVSFARFEGTRVSIETFLKWRQQFEEDLGIDKKRELAEKEGRKLTGTLDGCFSTLG